MLPKPTTALRSNFTEFLDLHCLPNGLCLLCSRKTLEKMIKTMQKKKKMYILGTNTAVVGVGWGGGLNVERPTTGCNITGGCRMKKKKNYVLKMKLHFEKTLFESVLFLSHLFCPFSKIHILIYTNINSTSFY